MKNVEMRVRRRKYVIDLNARNNSSRQPSQPAYRDNLPPYKQALRQTKRGWSVNKRASFGWSGKDNFIYNIIIYILKLIISEGFRPSANVWPKAQQCSAKPMKSNIKVQTYFRWFVKNNMSVGLGFMKNNIKKNKYWVVFHILVYSLLTKFLNKKCIQYYNIPVQWEVNL